MLDLRIHLLFSLIKENLQEIDTRWRIAPTASEKMVDISKDYKLNNICHENIIVPNCQLIDYDLMSRI